MTDDAGFIQWTQLIESGAFDNGAPFLEANALVVQAINALASNQAAEAKTLLEECFQHFDSLGSFQPVVSFLDGLTKGLLGDPDAARRALREVATNPYCSAELAAQAIERAGTLMVAARRFEDALAVIVELEALESVPKSVRLSSLALRHEIYGELGRGTEQEAVRAVYLQLEKGEGSADGARTSKKALTDKAIPPRFDSGRLSVLLWDTCREVEKLTWITSETRGDSGASDRFAEQSLRGAFSAAVFCAELKAEQERLQAVERTGYIAYLFGDTEPRTKSQGRKALNAFLKRMAGQEPTSDAEKEFLVRALQHYAHEWDLTLHFLGCEKPTPCRISTCANRDPKYPKAFQLLSASSPRKHVATRNALPLLAFN